MNGPRNPVLEELIVQAPENESIKLVYGDWLLGQDSPWGELIALQHAILPTSSAPLFEWDDPAGITAAVREHPIDRTLYAASIGTLTAAKEPAPIVDEREAELRGAIENEIFATGTDPRVVWHCGFIRRVFLPQHAGFRHQLEDTLIRLLEHPAAMALEELALGAVEWNTSSGYHRGIHYQNAIEVLAVLAPQALRRLVLGAWSEHDISWTAIGELRHIYPALPKLRELELQAGYIDLGDLVLPELRKLLIRSGGLYVEAIDSLHHAECPLLESLTIWFGRPDYGGSDDIEVTEPFLTGERFPHLRHLGLANAEFTDALCERLPHAPILPHLTSLDLSLGNMSDDGAKVILRQASAFEHLGHLDVRGNGLSASICARLTEAFASVDTRFQSSNHMGRYASVGE